MTEDQRSPMWSMEEGFDTPEKFAVLLAKCFGWDINLIQAPAEFTKWHEENSEPYFIYDCGLTDKEED